MKINAALIAVIFSGALAATATPAAAIDGPALCGSHGRYAAHWVKTYRHRGCRAAYSYSTDPRQYFNSCMSRPYEWNIRSPKALGFKGGLEKQCRQRGAY